MSGRAGDLYKIGTAGDFADQFGVSAQTVERLARYNELLRFWQKAVNLVAASTLDDVWCRHFADSAQLISLAPDARNWLDLGAGAGFPGMVIAILGAESGVSVGLVESSQRKCAFLAEVAREIGVVVDIHNERIESFATERRIAQFDVITARGLAPLKKLLHLSYPLFGPDTVGLFLKGKHAEAEVEAAKAEWTFHVKLVQSRTDRHARIVDVREPIPRG